MAPRLCAEDGLPQYPKLTTPAALVNQNSRKTGRRTQGNPRNRVPQRCSGRLLVLRTGGCYYETVVQNFIPQRQRTSGTADAVRQMGRGSETQEVFPC